MVAFCCARVEKNGSDACSLWSIDGTIWRSGAVYVRGSILVKVRKFLTDLYLKDFFAVSSEAVFN